MLEIELDRHRIRGTSAIMVLTAVWMALGMIVLTNSNVLPYLMGINIGITVINAGALLLLIREGMHLVRRHFVLTLPAVTNTSSMLCTNRS